MAAQVIAFPDRWKTPYMFFIEENIEGVQKELGFSAVCKLAQRSCFHVKFNAFGSPLRATTLSLSMSLYISIFLSIFLIFSGDIKTGTIKIMETKY